MAERQIVTRTGNGPLTPQNPLIVDLVRFTDQMHAVVPLDRVQLVPVNPQVDPAEYDYQVKAADGRIWNQHFTMDNMSDPLMSFEGPVSFWRITEFALQRPIRDTLVTLVSTQGMTYLRYTLG